VDGADHRQGRTVQKGSAANGYSNRQNAPTPVDISAI